MSDETSQLPWSAQQWAALRAVVQESARNARVASSFLPLAGPVPREQTTVPALWMDTRGFDELDEPRMQRGEAEQRLDVREGKTLHLTTISANVYLRGSDIADPELAVAKSMVRRAAEILGRLEDAIIFNGQRAGEDYPRRSWDTNEAVVKPVIYRVSGGRRKTGLLNAPDVLVKENIRVQTNKLRRQLKTKYKSVEEIRRALKEECGTIRKKAMGDLMSVPTPEAKADEGIVEAIVHAIEKLEARGHFGPFAVVLGHELFKEVTSPTPSMVLPSDRVMQFLDGGRLMRSGTLPPKKGVVVALAGAPVELLVGTDMDVRFLQVTLEPRTVLRVYERFALRVKQLDAICRISRDSDDNISVSHPDDDIDDICNEADEDLPSPAKNRQTPPQTEPEV